MNALATADLYVYWCPICKRQTERGWHIARRGDPLIPQNDDEHYCERIKVVPESELERLREGLRDARRDLHNIGVWATHPNDPTDSDWALVVAECEQSVARIDASLSVNEEGNE